MNGGDTYWLLALSHVATALVFLCLGWRFGRESVDRPPFVHPLLPQGREDLVSEVDPWTLAATGDRGPGAGVDRKETAGLP